ncbi:hypothetical protein RCC89_06390 [Cytophagaceae bacterium ABcell3]|nr:hypothetical protein RCC89_06390 [Cytophagaceae bacterium ABcell3]
MKKCLLIIVFLSLLACKKSSKNSTDRLNNALKRIELMDLHPTKIYQINNELIGNDSTLHQKLVFFKVFDDNLRKISFELVSFTGGYNENVEYIGLPGDELVDIYFYKENTLRSHANKFFLESLDTFLEELKKNYPESTFEVALNENFAALKEYYKVPERSLLFKNMYLNEAMSIILNIRKSVAFEQTELLIKHQAK